MKSNYCWTYFSVFIISIGFCSASSAFFIADDGQEISAEGISLTGFNYYQGFLDTAPLGEDSAIVFTADRNATYGLDLLSFVVDDGFKAGKPQKLLDLSDKGWIYDADALLFEDQSDAPVNEKAVGLLFVAYREEDHTLRDYSSKVVVAVAPFDNLGRALGEFKVLYENHISVGWGMRVAASAGPDSCGVAVSEVAFNYENPLPTSAFFINLSFDGDVLGEGVPLDMGSSPGYREIEVSTPVFSAKKWFVPAVMAWFDAGGIEILKRELLIYPVKTKKAGRGSTKLKALKKVTLESDEGKEYQSIQFLPNNNGSKDPILFYQKSPVLKSLSSGSASLGSEYYLQALTSNGAKKGGASRITCPDLNRGIDPVGDERLYRKVDYISGFLASDNGKFLGIRVSGVVLKQGGSSTSVDPDDYRDWMSVQLVEFDPGNLSLNGASSLSDYMIPSVNFRRSPWIGSSGQTWLLDVGDNKYGDVRLMGMTARGGAGE